MLYPEPPDRALVAGAISVWEGDGLWKIHCLCALATPERSQLVPFSALSLWEAGILVGSH